MGDRPEELLVYGVRYARVDDARADFERLRDLHDGGHLGRYDAAVVRLEEDGEPVVADMRASERGSGAWLGGVAGGLFGAVFPPSIIASAAIGAAAGGIGGNVARRLTKRDAKELAQLLEPGQTGLIVVTDELEEPYRPTLFAKALKARSMTIAADEDLKRAVFAEARLNR